MAERDEMTEQEKRLPETGQKIRLHALGRLTVQEPGASEHVLSRTEDPSQGSKRPSPSPRGKKRGVSYDSDLGDKRVLMEDIKNRRELEQKRLRMKESLLELEKGRDRRMAFRDAKVQDREKRKLVLAVRKA
eukprot:gb/GEZJ01003572.1/.p1 GENE.gb/GEZJ01003572.1/~~gb/GEZJ01003572.1/.p1  ORF type:complete len:132 (-),score=20.70 gb/GEZJ01003572.1/:493-888(-)